MDFKGLKDALTPTGTLLTIDTTTLAGTFANFLGKYYFAEGKQLQLSNVEVTLDEPGRVVQLTGRGNFLNVANLPVRAVFSIDEHGTADAVITYTLLDGTGSLSAWKFSKSFPTLPQVGTAARGKVPPQCLDELSLATAAFIVSTRGYTDPVTHAALPAGIGFAGKLNPTGLIGALDGILSNGQALPLYGQIQIPVDQTDIHVPSLGKDLAAVRTYPWDYTQALPGIQLWAPLGTNISIGKLTVHDTRLQIFCPLSSGWLLVDEVFEPITSVTGQLDLPSAGLGFKVIMTSSTRVASTAQPAEVSAFVEVRCQGLSIGNLAHLADLTGSTDLAAGLPDALSGVVKTLEKLSLEEIAFSLSVQNGLHLGWASISVGAPGASWHVWGDHVAVSDLGLRFDVLDPLGAASLTTSVWGTAAIEGVPLEIKASKYQGGFLLAGQLKDAQRLPLKQLMRTYAPAIPPPADLTIDGLRVSIDPSGMQLAGALAQEPQAWTLALGPAKLALSDVEFNLAVPTSGSVSGMFRGDICLGSAVKLSMEYATPGNFAVKTVCKEISFSQLYANLTSGKGFLPAGFDLTLLDSSVLIDEQNGTLRFQLATRVSGLGCLAFEAKNLGSEWGFAVGLDLATSPASALPGLAALTAFEQALHLEKLALVVASYDNAAFQFPDLAQFQNPAIGTGKVALPAQSGGLKAGFNLFGEWHLDSNNKMQNLLGKLLGLEGTLGITLQLSPNTARLFVRRDAKVLGHAMSCEVGMMSMFGPGVMPVPSYFLTGSITVNIQGSPQTFDVSMASVPTGAFLSATMKGTAPIDCKLFKLSNVALEIGVDWAGIPSLGLAATIDVKDFESSIAVFFDSTDPLKSVIAGSVDKLSLKDVAHTLVGSFIPSSIDAVLATVQITGTNHFKIPGSLADALDGRDLAQIASAFLSAAKIQIPASPDQVSLSVNKAGTAWHLTDVTKLRHYALVKSGADIDVSLDAQFYFSPQRTLIGTIVFPQGCYLDCAIEFAGFHAAATVNIAANQGISVDAQLDKIVIVDENLFSIAGFKGGGGLQISISNCMQPDHPVAAARLPHFFLNGALTLLGIKEGIYASVSISGIEFDLTGQLLPGVSFDVNARFGKSGLGASGNLKVGVGTIDLGALGKAKINTELLVALDLDIDEKAKTVSLAKNVSFAKGATLLSNERATLVFQSDGNLVLYKTSSGSPEALWTSNTGGRGGTQVVFQSDGNLVIYDGNNKPLWASNTNGPQIAQLALQDDLNVVIYDSAGKPHWASNTNDSGSSLELQSSFEFAGQHIDLGKFQVDVTPDAFVQLSATLTKKVEAALREVFKDATKWANAVSHGVMDGVNDTAKVFKDVYGKSDQEAKALAGGMSKGATVVAHAAESTVKSAESTAKKAIKKVKFW